MKEFLAQYCARNSDKINHDLFDRTFDRPLVDFVVDSIKNLEVLPAIKLDRWELITDQTRIRTTINKRLNKDAKIKNNKVLERLVPLNGTLADLLVLHFTVSAKGRTEHVTRRMLVLKEMPGHYYVIGGKKVTLINQVVDNSTFVKGDVLKFKTIQFPIDLYLVNKRLETCDGSSKKVKIYRMDLFGKESNPLQYYLAKFGIMDTIEMFGLEDVMAITYYKVDKDRYQYYRLCEGLFLEVNRKALKAHDFVERFAGTLYDAVSGDLLMTATDALNIDYWLGRLSEVFIAKRQVARGKKALISFGRIMDPTTKKRLMLRKQHKRDSFCLVRWLITNFDDLMKKDNHDLKFKRLRGNECIAYFFDSYITRNVYSLLNSNNVQFDRYLKLLNTIHDTALLKSGRSGSAKGSSHSIYRYERYNDFSAIDACRHSLKGPNGLNGGKNGVSPQYKDIYPSHLGRYDLNVCSSASPGLTGYLAANCQLGENGYFDSENNEPDNYDKTIQEALEDITEYQYQKKRMKMLDQEKRDKDGFLVLEKKRTNEDWNREFDANPEEYGLYRCGKELRIMPVFENVDAKGFIQLIRINDTAADEYQRDKDGFIILEKIPKLGKR